MTNIRPPKLTRRVFWLHALPLLHLFSCLFFGVAHVDAAWGYMFLVDIPMSVIILAVAYNFDHPMILFGILGTLWWYLLSRAADMVIRRLRAKDAGPTDASAGR
jgi:hypothetical protein